MPPRDWLFPSAPAPPPQTWNEALVTRANVDALYAARPWGYLTQPTETLTTAAGDASFQALLTRYRWHLDHWAQAYWEGTHELLIPANATWASWRRRRNSRRSHAGDHWARVVRSTVGRWYPGVEHATLQEALDAIDSNEPWRRFFRGQPDARGNCAVGRAHPAYALARLRGKFVQEI
ncbi:uncharacterized protein IUM83_03745 [Phytophthora cinnamomi]|uniref:uncharacterized protein n=1 Tax=Phytophthora cinnamomi TaxID=4785 RepID=UPI0035593CD4|nr:hypothetical protein IUM83_03745 [Phytophthora cinnamomi]